MIPLEAALAWIDRLAPLGPETIPLEHAAGRVLARAYPAPARPPPHAAIDGHAVRAADTEGASDYAPLPLRTAPVVAGAPLPFGDAVLPPHLVEHGCALAATAAGDGVARWDDALRALGTILRPPDLAALARLGEPIDVIRRPTVQLRIPGAKSGPDLLGPLLRAAIANARATIGPTPDLIILAGRSGPGPDDDAVHQIDTLLAHGIRLRPGETTALGQIGATPALLLPGDPAACATLFVLLAARALRRLGRRPDPAAIHARLARKIVSGLGQTDAVRVRLEHGEAIPVHAPFGAFDGIVLVPEASEGYSAGTMVPISPLL